MKIKLVLPWPPSVNHYWHRARNGGMFISKEGRDFREDIGRIVASMHAQSKIVLPFNREVSVAIVCHQPDKRRRDIDNILKALLDALQHAGVYRDDNQVSTLTTSRGAVDKANPRVIVLISEIK